MSDYIDRYTNATSKELSKKIQEVYKQASDEIHVKLKEFIDTSNRIDQDMLNRVNNGTMSMDDYSKWRKGYLFRLGQWKQKLSDVTWIYTQADSKANQIISGTRKDVFTEAANYAAYQIEKNTGGAVSFNLYDQKTIERLMMEDPKMLPEWKIDEPKDYVWNEKRVNNAVLQGVIQGEAVHKIGKRLEKDLSTKNANKMNMFARTALTGAQNAGRIHRMKQSKGMGINVRKRWLAAEDARTRRAHAQLNGQEKDVDEPFESILGEIMYPGDPYATPANVYNCRCTLTYHYPEGDEFVKSEETYEEWKDRKTHEEEEESEFTQIGIAKAKSVEEINKMLSSKELFRTKETHTNLHYDRTVMKWVYDTVHEEPKANLTGCDLDSAKSIASAYQQIFSKFPTLKGKLDPPDAHPFNMGENVYAWCFIKDHGKVQVNPKWYSDWANICKNYEHDIVTGWHPKGTTAESIVTHEIGHAIDGFLAKNKILGGVTASGEFRYASSSLKNTIMKRVAKTDPNLEHLMEFDKVWGTRSAVSQYVSRYASTDAQEWFAECFAEYITSADPRPVAKEFGKELEKLMRKAK